MHISKLGHNLDSKFVVYDMDESKSLLREIMANGHKAGTGEARGVAQ